MDVAIPPLQFHTKEEYHLYRQCRLEGLTDLQIVIKFAENANSQTKFPKLLETVKNFAKSYDDFVNTSILLDSENLHIRFISSIESEDELVSSSDEEECEEEECEEENVVENTDFYLEDVPSEEHSNEDFHAPEEVTVSERDESVQVDSVQSQNHVNNPIVNLIVPVQIQNSNSETAEVLVRKPKRCQADKRSEAQRLVHKNCKYICGRTKCSGMKGHHLCSTPVEEYVKKVDVQKDYSLSDNRAERSRNVKRCHASDPNTPSILCLSSTCPGRGNRSLCTKFPSNFN
jgi:hypothetical protein